MPEALLAQGCLDSAGIESFLADINISRLEWPINPGRAVTGRLPTGHITDQQ
jgi:hypothetical protein